jgi:RNA recognition motif-containing protein
MNLYVGNLSPSVQQADLNSIFEGMGHVLYTYLAATDSGGHGYAFVNVPNEERARTAIASLNGAVFKGEKLTVRPMVERQGIVGAAVK